MEKMEAFYHDKAVAKGSLIVSACGFDSVLAELCLLIHSRHWEGPSVPNLVEAYLSLESEKKIVGNFGTCESAVLGVANANKLWCSESPGPINHGLRFLDLHPQKISSKTSSNLACGL